MTLFPSTEFGTRSRFETTETATIEDGKEVDVTKLINRLKSRPVKKLPLDEIYGSAKNGTGPPSRSSRDGFSKKRYEATDTRHPLIVDKDNILINGRHRWLKLKDRGKTHAKVQRATEKDIEATTLSWIDTGPTGMPIQFDASILGPWQGDTCRSMISQEHFPAGVSPCAALRFPLPVLMRYLNQRSQLQQVFSSKVERLVQLSAKLDEIQLDQDDDDRKSWGRTALRGAGNLATTAAVGGGTYALLSAHPLARLGAGNAAAQKATDRLMAAGAAGVNPKDYLSRVGTAFWKGARHARLSAVLDKIIEFDAGWKTVPTGADYVPGIGGSIRYGQAKKKGAGEHFKRTAGRYTGTAVGLGLGTVGALADDLHPDSLKGAAILGLGGLAAGSVVDAIRQNRSMKRGVKDRAPGDVARMMAASKKGHLAY